MKTYLKGVKSISLLLIIMSMIACSGKKEEESASSYPLFWTWLDYRPTMNFDSVCVVMKEIGIEGVMLNASTPDEYRQAIPIAHKHGIEVYAWLWTMNLEHDRDKIIKEHPEWFSVNRKGESLADTKAYVDYYKFMCPILPEVREHIRQKIIAYCEVEGLNGIAIDYHRFVDVILPTTLWPRYGIVQDREYPEWDYGYHPAMIEAFKAKHGYDPREQEDPSADDLWLQFRCDQITEVANEIADVVHSYGKVMAASPFPTPKMAKRMVRQDWGKWNLDIVFPMVYHNFYTGDVSFISDCTLENVRDKNQGTTLFCGMMASEDQIFDCMDEALNNGAEGIAIFTVNSLRSPEVRARFKVYTDSIKALHVKSTVDSGDRIYKDINNNPFENKGIMQAVHMRMLAYLSLGKAANDPLLKTADWSEVEKLMQATIQVNKPEDYINGLMRVSGRDEALQPIVKMIADRFEKDYAQSNLNLGDYRLTDEYGTTKHYQVIDNTSHVTFDVVFYFYGGILSGWDVKPEEDTYKKYRH